jgi:hypothetical protein
MYEYHGKAHLTINIEEQEDEKRSVLEWVPMVRRRVNREGKGGQIWSLYFLYVYNNRTLNLLKLF